MHAEPEAAPHSIPPAGDGRAQADDSGVEHRDRIVVLNVDDYEAGRYASTRILKQAGFNVLEAEDGQQALILAQRRLPDLVVLDVNLPDINGFEVCRQLKGAPATADIPVLYLSAAYRQAEHRVQGLELGADAYLTQPMDPRELVATVHALLRARSVRGAVRRSEERFRSLVQATAQIVWTTPPSGDFETPQLQWTQFTGQSFDELRGRGWLDAVHPDDRPATEAAWDTAVETRTPYEIEHRLMRKDGSYRFMLVRAVPVTEPDGIVREWVGAHSDITERKTMEQALRKSEARLRRIVEANMLGIMFWEADGRIRDANEAFLTMTGYTRDDVRAGELSWQTLTPPEHASADERARQELQSRGSCTPFEKEFLRADGTRVPVLMGGALLDDQRRDGVAFVLDITERKWAEDAQTFLIEASRIFAASLDYDTTLESIAHFAVPRLADTCVVHLVDEAGKVAQTVRVHADAQSDADRGATEAALRQHAIAAIRDSESVFLPDSAPSDAVSLMSLPLQARGRTLGAISFATDESARRYTPADLALAQELVSRAALSMDNARLYKDAQQANQAKSDFMAVTSHELRTPMNAVLGYVDLLSMGIGGSLTELQREQVDRIGQSARHLLGIIEEILTFSRVEAGNLEIHVEPMDVAELLNEVGAMVGPLARKAKLDFTVEVPDEPVTLMTDAHKVRQILLNLIGNAVKFTERGTVRTSARQEADHLIVIVADSGIGIPQQHIEKIFDPFWQVNQRMTRTKGGTGLGLTVTRQLVELLGGTIEVESEVGSGSTFRVRIPLHAPEQMEGDDA